MVDKDGVEGAGGRCAGILRPPHPGQRHHFTISCTPSTRFSVERSSTDRGSAGQAPGAASHRKFATMTNAEAVARLPQTSAEAVVRLPQDGVWHCYVHKLRAWMAGADGVPVRPYLMLVISTEVGTRRQLCLSFSRAVAHLSHRSTHQKAAAVLSTGC